MRPTGLHIKDLDSTRLTKNSQDQGRLEGTGEQLLPGEIKMDFSVYKSDDGRIFVQSKYDNFVASFKHGE